MVDPLQIEQLSAWAHWKTKETGVHKDMVEIAETILYVIKQLAARDAEIAALCEQRRDTAKQHQEDARIWQIDKINLDAEIESLKETAHAQDEYQSKLQNRISELEAALREIIKVGSNGDGTTTECIVVGLAELALATDSQAPASCECSVTKITCPHGNELRTPAQAAPVLPNLVDVLYHAKNQLHHNWDYLCSISQDKKAKHTFDVYEIVKKAHDAYATGAPVVLEELLGCGCERKLGCLGH